MCQIDDYKKVYKFSLLLNKKEEDEIEIVKELMPHHMISDLYTTNKRRNHIKKYIDNPIKFKLEQIVINLPSYIYLKEWMISGFSKIEQDLIFHKLLSDDTIGHFEENENMLERKSYGQVFKSVLLNDDFNSKYCSEQEYFYIMYNIFSKFGITSLGKYSLIRRLYMEDFINESHFELYMENDDKINKLIRMFVSGNIPIFSCDLTKNKKEYDAFVTGKYDNMPNEFHFIECKWTDFARKLHTKNSETMQDIDNS